MNFKVGDKVFYNGYVVSGPAYIKKIHNNNIADILLLFDINNTDYYDIEFNSRDINRLTKITEDVYNIFIIDIF